MAGSSSDLSAADLALLAANKPILVVGNALTGATAEWEYLVTPPSTFADADDVDYPATRLIDGFGHIPSRPAQTDKYFRLKFDLSAEGQARQWDTALLLCSAINDAPSMLINVSNDGSSWTNLYLDYSVAWDGNRHLVLDLSSGATPQRHTGWRYVLFDFGLLTGCDPSITEIILGKRYQLEHRGNRPVDEGEVYSSVADFEALSGATRRFVRHKGRARIQRSFTFADDDEADVLRQAFVGAEHGTQPVIWIEDPAESPPTQRAIYGFIREPRLSVVSVGPYEREAEIEINELPPYLAG